MQRHEIDPDTFMHSMMTECSKQNIPALLVYTVREQGKLMIRVRANRPAPEVQVIWDALHPVNDEMIETAAKALAAIDQVPWEAFSEEQRNQVRVLARTAVVAALRTHAPVAPPVTPALILSS